MLKISAIILVALVVVVVSGGAAAPNGPMPKKPKNGKHNTYPIIITSIILRSMDMHIFTDRRSCGNDFNTRILYHCK